MSNRWKPDQRETCLRMISNQIDDLKQRILDRPLLEHSDCQKGDILVKMPGGYLYRVEKVTPKTITLSEGRLPPNSLSLKDFGFGYNPKRQSADNFRFQYRKVTIDEFMRSQQLKKRNLFILNYKWEPQSI